MKFLEFINTIPWIIIIFFCLTIGLAPFSPPHVIEKLSLLMAGKLVKPIDWFDLALHGSPWVLLILKSATVPIIKITKNKQ